MDKSIVSRLGSLLMLKLEEDERETLVDKFADTINKIATIEELNTKQISPTYQVTGLTNIFQEATSPTSSLTVKEALQNANHVDRGLFLHEGAYRNE